MKSFKQHFGEDLRQWFKQKWVRMDTKGNIKGHCAREKGEGKPKCLPQAKAHALGKEGRAAAARRKRREDPNPERRGAPINVKTEEVNVVESTAAAIAAATAIAKKKSGNYDSKGFRKTAYKNPDHPLRKSNAEREKEMDEACWTGYTAKGMKKKGNRMVPNCVPEETVSEDGGAAGVASAGPTNVVGGGAIAGTGGKGGEPGVHLPRKKKDPIMFNTFRRKLPK
jgi:hypothetical protein